MASIANWIMRVQCDTFTFPAQLTPFLPTERNTDTNAVNSLRKNGNGNQFHLPCLDDILAPGEHRQAPEGFKIYRILAHSDLVLMVGLCSVYSQQMRINEDVSDALTFIQTATESHSTTIQQILTFLRQYYE